MILGGWSCGSAVEEHLLSIYKALDLTPAPQPLLPQIHECSFWRLKKKFQVTNLKKTKKQTNKQKTIHL